jgi:hypothetical protein
MRSIVAKYIPRFSISQLHNLAEESKSLFWIWIWIVKKTETSSFWIVKAISAQAILHTFKFTLPFENDFFHFTKIDERKRERYRRRDREKQ